jgi:hypothetical protein
MHNFASQPSAAMQAVIHAASSHTPTESICASDRNRLQRQSLDHEARLADSGSQSVKCLFETEYDMELSNSHIDRFVSADSEVVTQNIVASVISFMCLIEHLSSVSKQVLSRFPDEQVV